jgi:hypothetical protein
MLKVFYKTASVKTLLILKILTETLFRESFERVSVSQLRTRKLFQLAPHDVATAY